MQILVVEPSGYHVPGFDALSAAPGMNVTKLNNYKSAAEHVASHDVDAILIGTHNADTDNPALSLQLSDLLRTVQAERIGGLVLTGDAEAMTSPDHPHLQSVPPDASGRELADRVRTISHYESFIKRMERELDNMQRLGMRLNRHFIQVDQEMRMASRLQEDFLPKPLEPTVPLRFSAIYRPATWVSGDIYDVFRIDENHIGFYVADVVGHGMAAGLLTIFLKRSITGKIVEGNQYRLLTPSETLERLNTVMVDQKLENCQFVTCCYAVVNTQTLQMSYARGGHPFPLLVGGDGAIHQLKSEGGLMGLFAGEDFPTRTVQLKEGDKVIMFTDGVENCITSGTDAATNRPIYTDHFKSLTPLSPDQLTSSLNRHLDQQEGSLTPEDDITVLTVEVCHQ